MARKPMLSAQVFFRFRMYLLMVLCVFRGSEFDREFQFASAYE